MKLVLYWTNKK